MLYRDFVPGKGYDAKQLKYLWADGGYVRDGAKAPQVIKVVAEGMEGADVLLERSQEDRAGTQSNVFTYWIGRKVANGAYLIFPVNERDLLSGDRKTICMNDDPDGICTVTTHEQLMLAARATAKMPPLDPTVAIIIDESKRKDRPF